MPGNYATRESDRIAALATNLRAMGAGVEELAGWPPRRRRQKASWGGHSQPRRSPHSDGVRGCRPCGWSETRIHEAECADVSFPGFGRFSPGRLPVPERA